MRGRTAFKDDMPGICRKEGVTCAVCGCRVGSGIALLTRLEYPLTTIVRGTMQHVRKCQFRLSFVNDKTFQLTTKCVVLSANPYQFPRSMKASASSAPSVTRLWVSWLIR